MAISKILIQAGLSSLEVRAVKKAVALLDGYSIELTDIQHVKVSDIREYLPVGSVEFVRAYMVANGITEPYANPYPSELYSFLKRSVITILKFFLRDEDDKVFIKPKQTKLFTGFVFNSKYDDHDIEQLAVLATLPITAELFMSSIVEWNSEWRYYIKDRKILGKGRYDDGPDEWAEPDITVVQAAVEKSLDSTCCLDFGVLSTGETALVERNDAWAIGLYEDALDAKTYLDFLKSRWEEIIELTLRTE